MEKFRHNRSVFEANFDGIFETYKNDIKNSDFRYYMITVFVTQDGQKTVSNMRKYLSFNVANCETLLLVDSFSKLKGGESYYVGLWKGHRNGTCNRVCYAERARM